MKGSTRMHEATRAYALRLLGSDVSGAERREALLHKNYHVRRAAWRSLGRELPGELSRASLEELARKLHPNLVENTFKHFAKAQEAKLQILDGKGAEAKDDERRRWAKSALEFLVSLLVKLGANPDAELADFVEEEGLKPVSDPTSYTSLQ